MEPSGRRPNPRQTGTRDDEVVLRLDPGQADAGAQGPQPVLEVMERRTWQETYTGPEGERVPQPVMEVIERRKWQETYTGPPEGGAFGGPQPYRQPQQYRQPQYQQYRPPHQQYQPYRQPQQQYRQPMYMPHQQHETYYEPHQETIYPVVDYTPEVVHKSGKDKLKAGAVCTVQMLIAFIVVCVGIAFLGMIFFSIFWLHKVGYW